MLGQCGKNIVKKKEISFEESILGKMGWNIKDFIDIYWDMLNIKIAHNIRLTQQETKDFIAMEEVKNEMDR